MGDWNLFANQLKNNYERIRIRSHFCGWNVHFVWFMEKGIRIPFILVKNGVEITCWKKVIFKGVCESYKTWHVLFYFIFPLPSLPLGMVVIHICLM